MASKSTKPKHMKSPAALRTIDESDDDKSDGDDDAFRFCDDYLHGIKTSEIWNTPDLDPTISTYFILPEPPAGYVMIENYVSLGMINPIVRDFEKFWFELSDLHKDRYVLVNFMATLGIRVIEDEEDEHVDSPNAQLDVAKLWLEKMSQMSQLIRGYVMEKNSHKFRRDGALSLFLNTHSVETLAGIMFPKLPKYSSRENASSKVSLSVRLVSWIGVLIEQVFSGFVNTYFVWASYDAQNLRRYAMEVERKGASVVEYLDGDARLNQQIDFMRKLKLAAPRWSQGDRRMMLDAIESGGKSCRGTYVQVLLDEVGVEKFKKLVFGKQHFCAHCRRSSYIGEDRMLACKRCDTEGVRPRAWYCNKECQKSDWRRHRASKHPIAEVVQNQVAKKKKRKPRKK